MANGKCIPARFKAGDLVRHKGTGFIGTVVSRCALDHYEVSFPDRPDRNYTQSEETIEHYRPGPARVPGVVAR